MRSLQDTRKEKGLTQTDLESLTGIKQGNLSSLENGKYIPSESTRQRIEAIVGHVDWAETSPLKLLEGNYFACEQLIHKLINLFQTMNVEDKLAIKTLVKKYFE